jgi:hypothetical protein
MKIIQSQYIMKDIGHHCIILVMITLFNWMASSMLALQHMSRKHSVELRTNLVS